MIAHLAIRLTAITKAPPKTKDNNLASLMLHYPAEFG
jgi:hypothetical protein